MPDDKKVPRRKTPTLLSVRLGRELRRLREATSLSGPQVGELVNHDQSWVSRAENGLTRLRVGDVAELLMVYGIPVDGEHGQALIGLAGALGRAGWWERLDTLPQRYLAFIAFENEAIRERSFEPILVPGLLQTPNYAQAVISIGREDNLSAVQQRIDARLARQTILTREKQPVQFHAILSEAALLCQVGGPEVLREQLESIIEISALPTIIIQVLRFTAGAHLADLGGFTILEFGDDDPDLGTIETLAGSLFVEQEVGHLNRVFRDLVMRSMSPAESIIYIQEMVDNGTW